jgi:hypothetical protein
VAESGIFPQGEKDVAGHQCHLYYSRSLILAKDQDIHKADRERVIEMLKASFGAAA